MIRGIWRFYRVWVAGVAGYLIGCVLTADIAARLAARDGETVDLRAIGSGNPGAANSVVNLGKGWGAAVTAGDISKGAIAATIGRFLAGSAGAQFAGICAVAGHCFPAFANFRGGKGLAPAAGSSLVTFPVWMPVNLLVLGSVTKLKGVAIGTYVTATALVLGALAWWCFRLPNWKGTEPNAGLPLWAICSVAMICYRFLTAPDHFGDRDRAPEPALAEDEAAGAGAPVI